MTSQPKFVIAALASTLLISCGGGGGRSNADQTQAQEAVVADYKGKFSADLRSMNLAAPEISGSYSLSLNDELFEVSATVRAVASGARHFQYIIQGKCQFSDQNGDSLIDMNEVLSQGGKILVPLDSNLEDQLSGSDFGPIANAEGKFVYKRSADALRFMDDLLAQDPDTHDEFVKISQTKDLRLESRSVILLGVGDAAALPESVASFRNLSRTEGLPIACGELVRVL